MVRKRSRKRSSRRKYYESDENDSDSDIDLSSPPASPARKRYGLRQRKQPIFFHDFDNDDDEDLGSSRKRSDDDEFDVPQSVQCSARLSTEAPSAACRDNELDEGALIDFEDVIRADVVLNKQKAECNSGVVNRTVVTNPDQEKGNCINNKNSCLLIIFAGRRIKKLKVKPDLDDTKLEVQIDPLNFVTANLEEPLKANGVTIRRVKTSEPVSIENGCPIMIAPSSVETIEKYIPPVLDEKEKQVILSNEYLLGNSFDMSADEFLEKLALKKEEKEEEQVPEINFDEDSGSSDDVILIEKKPEIIVLDDDD